MSINDEHLLANQNDKKKEENGSINGKKLELF
jgi:hypothetical protein